MECNLPAVCACVCVRVCNYLVLWHTAPFPGDGHCSLIKVGLFHRQSEVCEGASERPDERADSSGEKLLPFFFFLSFLQHCSGSPPPSAHLLHPSLFLSGCAHTPRRHLVSHYSRGSFLAECRRRLSSFSRLITFSPLVFPHSATPSGYSNNSFLL